MSEYKKLDNYMRSNGYISEYKIEQVSEVGYVIYLTQRPVSGAKLILFDLDDTLIASWAAMKTRIDNFISYCRTQGITAADEDLMEVFKLADQYARWPEHIKPVYHFQYHVYALAYTVSHAMRTGSLPTSLDLRFEGLRGEYEIRTPDNLRVVIDHLMEYVFNVVIQPETFNETTQAAITLANAGNNVGIFTYGEPLFQLQKALVLLENQPSIPVSQIWLTKVNKGDFTHEVVKGSISPEIEKILVVDDSPLELESILQKMQANDIRVHAVRSLRPGTKTESHVWSNESSEELTFNTLKRQLTSMEIHAHVERILDDTSEIE